MRPSEVNSLKFHSEFLPLWQAITIIEAREMLMLMNANSYPNMKEGSKKNSLFEKIRKQAYPEDYKKSDEPITTREMAKLLGVL